MKTSKVFLVLLGLLLLGAAVFAQSVPYNSSNATGSSPIYPHPLSNWKGTGAYNDPWYNTFLDGAIEVRAARGAMDGNIGVNVKSNLDYGVYIRVKIQSANGKVSYLNFGRVAYQTWAPTTINPYPRIANSDGFSAISIVVVRSHDQNGRSYDMSNNFKNRTW